MPVRWQNERGRRLWRRHSFANPLNYKGGGAQALPIKHEQHAKLLRAHFAR
jgi:hypothetical protein